MNQVADPVDVDLHRYLDQISLNDEFDELHRVAREQFDAELARRAGEINVRLGNQLCEAIFDLSEQAQGLLIVKMAALALGPQTPGIEKIRKEVADQLGDMWAAPRAERRALDVAEGVI